MENIQNHDNSKRLEKEKEKLGAAKTVYKDGTKDTKKTAQQKQTKPHQKDKHKPRHTRQTQTKYVKLKYNEDIPIRRQKHNSHIRATIRTS